MVHGIFHENQMWVALAALIQKKIYLQPLLGQI
jgi:hypothetical protein